MGRAKDIRVFPISASDANAIIRSTHYSGKVAVTSRVHLGVFLNGRCCGALQFGNPIDKRKLIGLVRGTGWNDFLELNRMAFTDALPRNSESRAIGYSMRWLKKTYPHLRWIVSFADGTQCGDGTIYRASGFVLTGIRSNKTMWKLASGEVIADLITRQAWNDSTRQRLGFRIGESWKSFATRVGAVCLPGYQFRYLYFLDASLRESLTVPLIPFSRIDELGASMYKGQTRAGSAASGTSDFQSAGDGATPIPALSKLKEAEHGAT